MSAEIFNAKAVMSSLKKFQRKTVEHAFRRLYKTQNGSNRFLVADEVGLGKTLVARGIIAKAIKHLQEQDVVKRIDIIYVCSNAAIAQQNVNRLNVTGQQDYALATRLTLLPLELPKLGKRKLNFVSFTPGTTFDLKHSTGIRKERLLLFHVLKDLPGVDRSGLCNLMQCDVGKDKWRIKLRQVLDYDRGLVAKFLRDLRKDAEIRNELRTLCLKFHYFRDFWPSDLKIRRNSLISNLRKRLAKACVDALEPDLVILDEFQRFKDLLGNETDAGLLAQELMNYSDVRVILLSATPYKMLTLHGDEENHYKDFLHTLEFLFNNDRDLDQIGADLDSYRLSIYKGNKSGSEVRNRLQNRLRKVMLRTERVPSTKDRDAMVHEPLVETTLLVDDLHRAKALDQLTRAIGAQEAIEYWKSAPYLLNFMKGYRLKELFEEHVDDGVDLSESLTSMAPHLLSEKAISRYDAIDPGNSRLRALVDRTLSNDEWKLLWLPPSLSYIQSDEFSENASLTKSLIFSTWSVVPDVIAAVCSYTAERNRVLTNEATNYFQLHDTRSPLLVFRRSDERLDTMSTLLMLYPSPILSNLIDPMRFAMGQGHALSDGEMKEIALDKAGQLVSRLVGSSKPREGRADQAWYWAALAKRDFKRQSGVADWLQDDDGWRSMMARDGEQKDNSIFGDHVEYFLRGAKGDVELGAIPDDFVEVLAELAIGSPAVCANRALRRIASSSKADSPHLLQAASHIAEGFRSLFNSPDVRSMLEKDGVPYWRQVLRYCAKGDLQAVLDEYVHSLKESLGLVDAHDEKIFQEVAATIRNVLSIRTSSLDMDDIQLSDGQASITKKKIRCGYALRFADLKDDSDAVLQRAGVVREAFNSPFRPFILASTSVGQEGLDFHSYCHRVWHWNLPRNPVDMEQREGRVNRYKGHAVRKNVARAVGLSGLSKEWNGRGDPWDQLFHIAKRRLQNTGKGDSELMPYWIFEEVDDPSRIERLVPLPPFSSENARFKALKRNLAVYRLAFGQPRQEDLIEFLTDVQQEWDDQTLQNLQLDLSP
ncbi:MAG: hypothetical protein ACJAVI_005858 [Candidatus Azotimanducaceae bacterium]|jgi:hypothetical protein